MSMRNPDHAVAANPVETGKYAVRAPACGHDLAILLTPATIRGGQLRGGICYLLCLIVPNPKTGLPVQVLVRDNNVDQALRALKKKMQREGIFREMKMRGHYEKPSEKRAREKAEAVRRARKLARKRAQREGLLPSTPRPVPAAGAGRPAR
jgi:small subunit ribosomal protein S21